MMKNLCFCAVFAAVFSAAAYDYDDDHLSVDGDGSVSVTAADGRIVYVFTNTAAAATVTLKQTMTLEEALLVGGGGAGGWGYKADNGGYGAGAGGGGGGVVLTNVVRKFETGQALTLTVGEGGDPSEFVSETVSHPRGGNGHPTTLSFGEVELTAFGGGGGASWDQKTPGRGQLGSGGGGISQKSAVEDWRYAYDGVYYTSAQGYPGGYTVDQFDGAGPGGGAGAINILGQSKDGQNLGCAGGEGLHLRLTGDYQVYGSGGGGGYSNNNIQGGADGGTNAGNGGYRTNNRMDGLSGFGGGGGGNGRAANAAGGRGGSGSVILVFREGDTTGAPRLKVAEIGRVPLKDGVAEPVVRVSCGETVLSPGDYEVTYANNTEIRRIATATVTGLGAYAGQVVTKTFEVIGRVIYVAPEVAGTGDGSSWANATVLADALTLATSGAGHEIWMKAGTYPVTDGFSTSKSLAIRGGFAGDDADPQKLADFRYSVFDGQGTANYCFSTPVSTSTSKYTILMPIEFERCWFRRAMNNAFVAKADPCHRFYDCKMTEVTSLTAAMGRGLYVKLAGKLVIVAPTTLIGCEISQNEMSGNDPKTSGAYFANTYVYMEDCFFASNTLSAASSADYSSGYAMIGENGFGAVFQATHKTIAKGCRFVGNRGTLSYTSGNSRGGALCYLGSSASGSVFENCLWLANCDQGRNYNGTLSGEDSGSLVFAASGNMTVSRCTFAYNVSAAAKTSGGIHMMNGSVNVSDSVFYGNTVYNKSKKGGADIYLASGATALVSNTLFAAEAAADQTRSDYLLSETAGNLVLADDVVFGNPQFVTPTSTFLGHLNVRSGGAAAVPYCGNYVTFAADNNEDIYGFDVHLLSPGGYYTNDGTWHKNETDKTSDAILSSGENLGCYAGTPEESKLAEVSVEFVGDVTVTFPDGTSQPTITFELGGNGGVPYNAAVEMTFGVEGDMRTITIPSVASGAPYGYLAPYAFLTNAAFTASVTATIAGGSASKDALPAVTPTAYPATYGHGGGAGVIHVRSGATGLGDGSSWFDAMTDFHAALNAISDARHEVWFAGSTTMSYKPLSIAPPVAAVIRGGFAGTENSSAARAEGAVSVVDGDGRYQPLELANANAVEFERLVFTHGPSRNVLKSGAGDITFTDCAFSFSRSADNIEGRGIHLTGGGATVARFLRCSFEGNLATATQSRFAGRGVGAYFTKCARVELEESLFATNGYVKSGSYSYSQASRNHGSAIYAVDAPVVATKCRFLANFLPGDQEDEGGAVSLSGACGGSAFTNCLFAGNDQVTTLNNGIVFKTAALIANMANADDTLDVENCTFAYNLTSGCLTNATDICLQNGAGIVRNSVFVGTGASCGRSLLVNAGATVDVSYSIFPKEDYSAVAVGSGVLTLGEGVLYGDPLLVTPVDAYAGMVSGGLYTTAAQREIMKVNAHLRGGKRGYLDEKTGEIVRWSGEHSPAIDAGDPRSSFKNEAKPNGRCVNMGFYGNTKWATMSGAGLVLFVQ